MTFSFREAAALVLQQFDPRGRCNRQGFLAVALILMGLQALGGVALHLLGQDLNGSVAALLNLPLFYVGYIAVLKRVHDIGRSGWWVPTMFAIWIVAALTATTIIGLVVGPDQLAAATEARSALFWLIIAVVAVPAFGGLIWVHTAGGDIKSNRFGPVPGATGFAFGHPRKPVRSEMPIGAMPAG